MRQNIMHNQNNLNSCKKAYGRKNDTENRKMDRMGPMRDEDVKPLFPQDPQKPEPAPRVAIAEDGLSGTVKTQMTLLVFSVSHRFRK